MFHSIVSIPHRYGKNRSDLQTIINQLKFPFLIGTVRTKLPQSIVNYSVDVSIPHRYGKNRIQQVSMPTNFSVSIPHRYGKNESPVGSPHFVYIVSIPHRYGKNFLL